MARPRFLRITAFLLAAAFTPGASVLAAGPSSAIGAEPRSLETLNVDDNSVVIDTSAEPTSLDPAVAYDDASGSVIQAVYETLVTYDRNSTDTLRPLLAESIPTVANGGVTNGNLTYTFDIRQGVYFHSGNRLEAEDVVYSFQRVLLIDDPDGPAWMLGQVLVPTGIAKVGAYRVSFTLTRPYSAFLAILAYTEASIVSRLTVEAHGGTVAGTQNAWMNVNEDGTGPFTLRSWNSTQNLTLDRYSGYWDTGGAAKVSRVTMNYGYTYAESRDRLLAGSADIIGVAASGRSELIALSAIPANNVSLSRGASTWIVTNGAFNMNINTTSRYLFGAVPYPDNVPSDFFADAQMRRAFSQAYDYADYLSNVTSGTALRAEGVIPRGMYGDDPSIRSAAYDLEGAKASYNRTRWATDAAYNPAQRDGGFNMTIVYNLGNSNRQRSAEILKQGVEQLGPNVHVNVAGVDFPTFLEITAPSSGAPGPAPVFFVGWGPDYADPDDYVVPFLRSGAIYTQRTGFSNATLDGLIANASGLPNGPSRKALYAQIEQSAVDECVYLFIAESGNFHAQNASLLGWYFNPMLSGGDLGGWLPSLYWPPPPDRLAPFLDAGGDRSFPVGRTSWLNGTASDNDLAFPQAGAVQWQFAYNGSNITLYGEHVSFVFEFLGVYAVTFAAVDPSGNRASQTINVTVTGDPLAPVAYAGGDVSIAAGTNWSFVGFATDDDPTFAETGSLGWRVSYNGSPLEFPGAQLDFTFWALGVFELTFFARDAWGNEGTDVRLVTVTSPDTTVPYVFAGADAFAFSGDTVFFNGSATDNDASFPSGALLWWTFTYDAAEVNLSGASVTFSFSLPERYVVTFHAMDAWGNVGSDFLFLQVSAPDTTAPQVAGIPDIRIPVGSYARFRADATDNDARFDVTGNFTWTFSYNGTTRRLYGADTGFTFEVGGTFVVSLVVRDLSGNAALPVVFGVQVSVPDTVSPQVDAGENLAAKPGDFVRLRGSAVDGGVNITDEARFTWTFVYNGNVTVLHGASPTFQFALEGTYDLTLLVLDDAGNAATDSVRVTVKQPPPPPAPPTVSAQDALIAGLLTAVAAGAAIGLLGRHLRRRRRQE